MTRSTGGPTAEPRARAIPTGRKLFYAALVTLAGLFTIEVACRLVLAVSDPQRKQFQVADGAVTTDWLHILADDVEFTERDVKLYLEDDDLFWKLRPETQATVNNLVYRTRGKPISWSLSINSDGNRGRPYPASDAASPVVVCIGDSCTFGFRVSDDETYPAHLESYLQQNLSPNAAVVNYGVPGYSTHQGTVVLDQVLRQNTPDVVIIGFGANDLERDRYSDREKATRPRLPAVSAPPGFEKLGFVRLLRGVSRSRRTEQVEPGQATRVSPTEYRENLRSMVAAARGAGCQVILLDLVFVSDLFRDTVAEVADAHDLPWLDGRQTLRVALDDLLESRRFQEEKAALDQFWQDEVVGFRPVYYSEEFYQQIFADETSSAMLRYLMVEPVHANSLGNQVLAEQIGQIVSDLVTDGAGKEVQPPK